jgi:hypothetical protein
MGKPVEVEAYLRDPDDGPLTLLASALHALRGRGLPALPPRASGRRFVIVHLDGVSRSALEEAMARGIMPHLRRRLRGGGLRLVPAFAGAPASTPAFQAALLYGVAPDVPGFLWWDRRRNKDVRMDAPAEALRLEEELAARHGPGLLAGGSAYFSILAGGAGEPAFTTSRLAKSGPLFAGPVRKNAWDHLASALAHAGPLLSIAGAVGKAAGFAWESARWALRVGRLKHEPMFLRNRVLLSSLATQTATDLSLLDIARGVPAVYTVYAGYDEVAHRRGPGSAEALEELAAADRGIEAIDRAIALRPELRYDLYVLSDHGQEETRPIERVLGGANLADWILAADERGHVDPAAVKELARRRLRHERHAALSFLGCAGGCSPGEAREGGGEERRPHVVVSDAGDFAHVYFADAPSPPALPEIEARWPGVLRAVLSCPASGLVAVRGGTRGFAFLRGRRFDLSDPRSLDGLLGYPGRLLARYAAAMLAMPSAGDLLVFGAGVPGGDVAYSWEFGSHGGLGRGDVETFFVHPAAVPFDRPVEGPRDLHRFFTERYDGHAAGG